MKSVWIQRATRALSVALLLLGMGSVQAITYGELDDNRHPAVGALVGTFNGQQYTYCSGALVSPTVFVTAAHCDIGLSNVTVTFDSQYSSKSKLHRGRYYAHPDYNAAQNDPHDLAVVVFDKPISGVAPVRLPTANLLDVMKANGLLVQTSQFTAVGYGGQERNFDNQGAPIIDYFDSREVAVSRFNSLNASWLRLSQNQATGDGGTCYGDSGGPNFLGAGAGETNVLIATTITGDAQCVATNVTYRLDTPSARAFLGQFVSLP